MIDGEIFVNGALWRDGWYLYTRGKITGPFSLSEIYAPNKKSEYRLLSRKGLRSWHSFERIQRIYAKENKLKTEPQSGEKSTSYSCEQSKLPTLPLPMQRETDSYQHLGFRGKLRLGTLPSPTKLAFIDFPLSLGLIWGAWYQKALLETLIHLDEPQISSILKGCWTIFIPGYHIRHIYRFARFILQMEVQNHYARTSPLLATILAFCPPLAIFYLQSALNHHWLLHVRHEAMTNQAPKLLAPQI